MGGFYHMLVLIILILVLLYILKTYTYPRITDIWVINLESRPDRMKNFIERSKNIPYSFNRFSAIYGKELNRDIALNNGIDLVVLADSYDESKKITKWPGVIGCWLSHKFLLQKLEKLPFNQYDGHLICEDDLDLNELTFVKWNEKSHMIPYDYDIVFFGISGEKKGGDGEVIRLKNNSNYYGTYCYLIRHGAIPRILNELKYFHAAIDIQYKHMFDDYKVYGFKNDIVFCNESDSKKTDIQLPSKEN